MVNKTVLNKRYQFILTSEFTMVDGFMIVA
jgi:hypothetical protein